MSDTTIKIVKESKDKLELRFELHNIDTSIVNGLRRTLLADLPVAAIRFNPSEPSNDNVQFLTNTCCLNNEFLGQRLSLIPLCFDESELDAFDYENYKFVIREKNKRDEPMDITTNNIKILNQAGVMYLKEFHEKIFPPDTITGDHILITKLKPNHYDPMSGDELHIEAYAAIGTAKEWAGFSAVSLATFENIVDDELAAKMLKEKLSKLKAQHGSINEEEVTHDFMHLDKYRYFRVNEHGDPSEFMFSIESTCGLPCSRLVRKALIIMGSKIQQISTGNIPLEMEKASNNVFTATMRGINHTQGSMLQSHIYNNCVRQNSSATFVGYNMPHPLEETIVLRFALKDQSASIADATQFVKDQAANLKKELQRFQDNWERVFNARPA